MKIELLRFCEELAYLVQHLKMPKKCYFRHQAPLHRRSFCRKGIVRSCLVSVAIWLIISSGCLINRDQLSRGYCCWRCVIADKLAYHDGCHSFWHAYGQMRNNRFDFESDKTLLQNPESLSQLDQNWHLGFDCSGDSFVEEMTR